MVDKWLTLFSSALIDVLQILLGDFFSLKPQWLICLGCFWTTVLFSWKFPAPPPPATANKPFRFHTMWIHHPEFPNIVKNAWESSPRLHTTIENFVTKAKIWNRTFLGNVFAYKKRVLARFNGTQKALSIGPSQFLIQLEKRLIEEYNIILWQEQEFWALKS